MPVAFSRTTHALTADSSRWSLVFWMATGVLLAVWAIWFFTVRVTVYEVSREARLEVEQTAYPLAAPVSGKVAVSHLAIGQMVAAGAVLVELDTTAERLRLREEQARGQALPAQIDALRSEIAAHEHAGQDDRGASAHAIETARARHREAATAAAFARDQAARLAELRRSGRVSEVDALRATAEADKLSAAETAAAADIRRLEGEGQSRVHHKRAEIEARKRQAVQLEGELRTTEAGIARIQQDIDKRTIRAAVAGQIGDVRPLPAGAYVSEGERLASLVPPGALRIVAAFPPVAVLGRIHPGQIARLRLDGFPWAQYGTVSAEVRRVASEVRDNRLRVEFVPNGPPLAGLALQHGLPGTIEVEIEQTTPALLALRAAGQIMARPAAAAPAPQPPAAPTSGSP